MRAGLHMAIGAAVLSGCAAPAAVAPAPSGAREVRVSGEAGPLANYEGAEAKRLANAQCGPKGVRSSINDRYENGTWVFVEGCA
jgi:hypothetical protein